MFVDGCAQSMQANRTPTYKQRCVGLGDHAAISYHSRVSIELWPPSNEIYHRFMIGPCSDIVHQISSCVELGLYCAS